MQLAIYFAILIGLVTAVALIRPEMIHYLPVGGTHALSGLEIGDVKDILSSGTVDKESAGQLLASNEDALRRVTRISLLLIGHLSGAVFIMVPITWTFIAIKHRDGFNKNFVRSLIILPICATTTVLLIQDSLALAFGLAALVAAVRFRVALDEAMDGIFIFAAICVGLAVGIGYLGVAGIMSIFFCFGNLILWSIDFGRNPVGDARQEKKRDKLARNRGNN